MDELCYTTYKKKNWVWHPSMRREIMNHPIFAIYFCLLLLKEAASHGQSLSQM